jgi:hypothetical protein
MVFLLLKMVNLKKWNRRESNPDFYDYESCPLTFKVQFHMSRVLFPISANVPLQT